MITSQGRYEPSPAGCVKWWPVKPIELEIVYDSTTGSLALSLDIGQCEILLFDQTAASLEVLGHALIRLAEEQRWPLAKAADLEPLQEK